eukprot:6172777-Pleurochrysis_carterae.AAC.2
MAHAPLHFTQPQPRLRPSTSTPSPAPHAAARAQLQCTIRRFEGAPTAFAPTAQRTYPPKPIRAAPIAPTPDMQVSK